ncbi:MAG: hypothetical protein CYG61_06150, partial [Actinobacteria bacterium]
MKAMLLGLAWGGVVLAAACRYRPLSRRLPEVPSHLEDSAYRSGTPCPPERGLMPVEALGRALLRLDPRRRPSSPAAAPARARRVGAIAVAAVLAAAVLPAFTPAVLLVGWAWPRAQARRQERRRLARLEAGLPEAVDLLVLA